MRPHHERAIQKLAEYISTQEEYLALIIGGSIAKGLEREDSDIDVVLVVTDEAFKERWAQNNLIFFSLDFCDYPGGYIDGKIVNLDYIKAAAERGNEVTRAAFNGAFVAFSRIPGLEEIIQEHTGLPAAGETGEDPGVLRPVRGRALAGERGD